jgi:hypothetical protein
MLLTAAQTGQVILIVVPSKRRGIARHQQFGSRALQVQQVTRQLARGGKSQCTQQNTHAFKSAAIHVRAGSLRAGGCSANHCCTLQQCSVGLRPSGTQRRLTVTENVANPDQLPLQTQNTTAPTQTQTHQQLRKTASRTSWQRSALQALYTEISGGDQHQQQLQVTM